MRFFALAALASTLTSTAYGFCGADPGTKEQIDAFEKEFQSIIAGNDTLAQLGQGKFLTKRLPLNKRAARVPVYWNVLFDQSTGEGGYQDSVIVQTLNVVNQIYAPAGLSFALAQAPRRIPVPGRVLHGFAVGNDNDRQFKAQYNFRQPYALNIYTVSTNSNVPLAGWASFPKDYPANPLGDGIIYDFNFLPGGRAGPAFNTGKIMAHEIGHWVGLYHTFQDGCNGGDQVDDTAPEASAASGCPTGRDTCPGGGPDPIQNMMDYSDDTCRQGFTNGQFNRALQQISYYRGIRV